MDTHIALYGSVQIQRVYCKQCETNAFVIKGLQACCDEPVKQQPKKFKIVSVNHGVRKKPSATVKAAILKIQDNKCLYCNKEFGTYYERYNKISRTKLHFDHLAPFSYTQNNTKYGFVAACHICNSIKSNKVFNTVEEVFHYVNYNRQKKGYKYFDEVSDVSKDNTQST